MSLIFKNITHVLSEVLTTFFESDMDVISPDAKKILSDKDDRETYLEGLKELRKQEKNGNPNPSTTITLKNNETFDLVR